MPIDTYYKSGFTIKRPIPSVDSGGSPVETFSDFLTTSGRMRPLTGTEILANEKLGLVTSHRFYCPVIDVEEKDRIYNSTTENTYEIKFVKNPMEMDDHLEIDCELIASPSASLPSGYEYFVTVDGRFFYEAANKGVVVLET